MELIKTRMHGMVDYLFSFLLFLPLICDYYASQADTAIFACVGSVIALYSLMTDYELGVLKLIPFKTHLAFDVLVNIFLISIPFLFPLIHYYFHWPVLLGSSGLIVVLFSSGQPYRKNRRDLDITKHA